jgi:hypothetical protein
MRPVAALLCPELSQFEPKWPGHRGSKQIVTEEKDRNLAFVQAHWDWWPRLFPDSDIKTLTTRQKKIITDAVDDQFKISKHRGRACRSRLKTGYRGWYRPLILPFMNAPLPQSGNPIPIDSKKKK